MLDFNTRKEGTAIPHRPMFHIGRCTLAATMELKNRSQYLDKLISVQDMEVIKVVTGIRRCGKSSLLKLMMAHLREQGVMEEQILSMNFESMQFADMDSKTNSQG